MSITKGELLKILWSCSQNPDAEEAHIDADAALLRYVDDDAVSDAYKQVSKWYS